jgi:hypothetical protein
MMVSIDSLPGAERGFELPVLFALPYLEKSCRRTKRYVTRLARLAFVSPMVAEAVAAGRAPAGINLQMLMDGRLALAPDWKDQQLLLQR